MTRFEKGLSVTVVSLIISILLLEATCLVYFYVRDGSLFYTHSQGEFGGKAKDLQVTNTVSADGQIFKRKLHPILGFVQSPSLSISDVVPRWRLDKMVGIGIVPEWIHLKANNFGFYSNTDYPVDRTDSDTYQIGVFGGSLAQWFSLQGAGQLRHRLQESGLLPNRKIQILNFAQGGFKQPQQLQALGYFLAVGQSFDFVINLDGFNEVALAWRNAVDQIEISMPSSEHLLPILGFLNTAPSEEYVTALLATKRLRARTILFDNLIQKNRSAFFHVLLSHLRQSVVNSYWESANDLDALSNQLEKSPLVHLNKPLAHGDATDDGDTVRQMASLWMCSSRAMDGMLKSLGIPYLHVLQPNQYVSEKDSSAKDGEIAIDPSSPYRAATINGYPYLLSGLDILKGEGVNAVSAVRIFDEVEQVVYSDSCCHLNQIGNDLLADFVADRMLEMMSGMDRRAQGM